MPGYHAAVAAMEALCVGRADERQEGEFTVGEAMAASSLGETATRKLLRKSVKDGKLLSRQGVNERGGGVTFYRQPPAE